MPVKTTEWGFFKIYKEVTVYSGPTGIFGLLQQSVVAYGLADLIPYAY
jgi:hypothetical protein